MSVITHVLIEDAHPADMARLNEWLKAIDRDRHQTFNPIDMDAAGGSKYFVEGVWAAALNYTPGELIDKLKDPTTWRDSPDVTWLFKHEDGWTVIGHSEGRLLPLTLIEHP